jgi:hypothetical protein
VRRSPRTKEVKRVRLDAAGKANAAANRVKESKLALFGSDYETNDEATPMKPSMFSPSSCSALTTMDASLCESECALVFVAVFGLYFDLVSVCDH